MKFRNLKPSEIECRVAQINQYGATLLLYKDARCDMNILDETVTPLKWKREHTRDNANCIVSIWSEELQQWISKEDTGAESFTEKEKGLASDSFKRACFNWGIGRELYTAPNIRVKAKKLDNGKMDIFEQNNKYKTYTKFSVKDIEYKDNVITYVEVIDQDGKVRYVYGKTRPIDKRQIEALDGMNLSETKLNKWLKYFQAKAITDLSFNNANFMLEKLEYVGVFE